MMIKTLEGMVQVIPLKLFCPISTLPFILVIDLKIPPHPCPLPPGERDYSKFPSLDGRGLRGE
mgnify:CR=1 FL=1